MRTANLSIVGSAPRNTSARRPKCPKMPHPEQRTPDACYKTLQNATTSTKKSAPPRPGWRAGAERVHQSLRVPNPLQPAPHAAPLSRVANSLHSCSPAPHRRIIAPVSPAWNRTHELPNPAEQVPRDCPLGQRRPAAAYAHGAPSLLPAAFEPAADRGWGGGVHHAGADAGQGLGLLPAGRRFQDALRVPVLSGRRSFG
jgi:hypothetical protein